MFSIFIYDWREFFLSKKGFWCEKNRRIISTYFTFIFSLSLSLKYMVTHTHTLLSPKLRHTLSPSLTYTHTHLLSLSLTLGHINQLHARTLCGEYPSFLTHSLASAQAFSSHTYTLSHTHACGDSIPSYFISTIESFHHSAAYVTWDDKVKLGLKKRR